MELNEKIKLTRHVLGMTQREFAEKLGVDFCTVNRWENAKHSPSHMAIKNINAMLRRRGFDEIEETKQ